MQTQNLFRILNQRLIELPAVEGERSEMEYMYTIHQSKLQSVENCKAIRIKRSNTLVVTLPQYQSAPCDEFVSNN